MRINIPEADAQLDRYYPVLDHGFVALTDYMGGDKAVERFARTSYHIGNEVRDIKETRTLLRYLMRHLHTSPYESSEVVFHVGLPIFVARQLIRHRSACLAGDVELHFDLPGGIERRGNQLHKIKIREFYEKFHSKKNNGSPFGKMNLRRVNESTGNVEHTNVVDIWKTGEKETYTVTLTNGSQATMSSDHLCLTNLGWKKLKEVVVKFPTVDEPGFEVGDVYLKSIGRGINNGVPALFNKIDETTEVWLPVVGWEGFYEVSDQGRVRRIVGGQGSRSFGRCKKLTVYNSHAVVSLNRPKIQIVEQVHELVLCAFVGDKKENEICRHIDGNGLNNSLTNIEWSTQQQNSDDRNRDGANSRLSCNFVRIGNIEYSGKQETFDLEVEGPHHNFSAGGIVVHNSLNEFSGRYSDMPTIFYNPDNDQVCFQSDENKQGSGQPVDENIFNEFTFGNWTNRQNVVDGYKWSLEQGISRETARIDLPLSTYTYMYWKMDLHNLMHFIGLRSDSHAQWEIQQYSDVFASLMRSVAPLCFEAFIDYKFGSVRFSRMEISIIRNLLDHEDPDGLRSLLVELGVSGKREQQEFIDKLQHKSLKSFDLPGNFKDAEFFFDKVKANL